MAVRGLDSSYSEPTDAELEAAKAGGIAVWSGYMATRQGVGLAHAWSPEVFARVKAHGLSTLAFVSGYDDPLSLRAVSRSYGLPICTDVEGGGLRPDGSWVQGFLDTSESGLYGNFPVHGGRVAPFHVGAAYIGYDPQASWPSTIPRPSAPCGWQWYGGHPQFGADVDSTWFDDWFAQGEDMTPEQAASLARIDQRTQDIANYVGPLPGADNQLLQDLEVKVTQLLTGGSAAGAAALPQDVQDAIKVIAAHIR